MENENSDRINANETKMQGYSSSTSDIDMTIVASVVLDGSGSEITTGIKADLLIPYTCIINRASLLADQTGDIAVDVWIDSYANFPPTDADSKITPEISSDDKYQSGTLSIPVSKNSVIRFNVDSCSTITRCLISLEAVKK